MAPWSLVVPMSGWSAALAAGGLLFTAASFVLVRLGLVRHTYAAAKRSGAYAWSQAPRGLREELAMAWSMRSHRAFRDGDMAKAKVYASRAVRWAPHVAVHGELRSLVSAQVESCFALLRDHEALDLLLEDRGERAENALQASHLCRQLGDAAGVAKWMAVARQASPEHVASVLATGRSRPSGSRGPGAL